MSTPALRTEQVYVTRFVRRGLEDLALLHLTAQPEGTEGPSISTLADGLADQILREHLESVPRLAERRRRIRRAIAEIDAELAQTRGEGGA